jgi:hypothetical protein
LQALTSSAAKIYIDLDITENKKFHDRYNTIQSYITIILSTFHNNPKLYNEQLQTGCSKPAETQATSGSIKSTPSSWKTIQDR